MGVGAKESCVCREAARGVICNRVFDSALYIIIRSLFKICLCATMVENVLEQVFACMIVNVFCNGIEQEEDGIEEVCFGIIVCAVVFLNGSC